MRTSTLVLVLAAIFAASTSAHAKSASRTKLGTSANPIKPGQRTVLTATVDGLNFPRVPTGSVTFSDNGTALGSARLRAPGAGQETLSAGDATTCAISTAGGVKCWGDNAYGQVGDGTTTQRNTPVDVVGLNSGIVAVTGGLGHSCALTQTGQIKCWGYNFYGELGDGTTTERHTPITIPGISAVAIAAGAYHTCAVTLTGAVKCWGWNIHGQLGDGTNVNRSSPVSVMGLVSSVVNLAGGNVHTCAVTNTGTAECWGYNSYGQIGDGSNTDRLKAVTVSGFATDALTIVAGIFHSCVLTTTATVKCWGGNFRGELGTGDAHFGENSATPVAVPNLTGVLALAANDGEHTCALTNAGGLKCWGAGGFGDGTTNDHHASPTDVLGLTNGVVAMTAGDNQGCATLSSGLMRCWGYNGNGEVGDGTVDSRPSPVAVTGFKPLLRSRARLITPAFAAGSHPLAATYAGDTNYNSSTGALTEQVR